MFKGLGNLGNLASMMREAQQMGGRVEAINERMKAQRISGTAGAGLVTAEVNGLGDLLKVRIDPTLIERSDREMIEDLVPAAVNQAVAKARERHAEEMKSLTDGIDLPGVQDALADLLSGNDGTAPKN